MELMEGLRLRGLTLIFEILQKRSKKNKCEIIEKPKIVYLGVECYLESFE